MAQQTREQWGTRAGFLFAAIGSAVGLGNIWRFPYIAYENGGGAFLLPYLVALLTAGIPLLILAYTIGHRYRGSPPLAFHRMSRGTTMIGWWQVAVSFVIATFYAVIIAWAVRFAGFSFGQQWGDEPTEFFTGEFLQQSEEPGMISTYVPGVLWPLLAVWVAVVVILAFGVRRGIEWANRIFIPLLVVLFGILVVQSLFLDGAADGLDALFSPDWSAITDGGVWVAAYGQIFFSLSVGFGIMITYASYLRRRADLTGTAMVAGFANSSFEILAGIGVFATLGFMSVSTGIPIGDDDLSSGPGLAFMAFPTAISEMPVGASLFGVLFFVSLAIAGLSSLISIVQVVVASVQDRTGLGRIPSVLLTCGATAAVSLTLYPTDSGLALLDTVDHFINSYGVALAALVIVVVVAWVLRALRPLQAHADTTSAVPLGWWWRLTLGVFTPLLLGWMMWDSLSTEFAEPYEGYPLGLLLIGVAIAVAAVVIGAVLALIPWRRQVTDSPQHGTTTDQEGTH